MHPNVDMIRRGFEAFDQGDLATLSELLSEDMVWVSESGGVLKGRFEGRDNVFANWALAPAETDGTFRQEVTSVHADDRVAVATVRTSAARRGKVLDGAPGSIVFQIRDGLVTSGRLIPEDPELNEEFWAE